MWFYVFHLLQCLVNNFHIYCLLQTIFVHAESTRFPKNAVEESEFASTISPITDAAYCYTKLVSSSAFARWTCGRHCYMTLSGITYIDFFAKHTFLA